VISIEQASLLIARMKEKMRCFDDDEFLALPLPFLTRTHVTFQRDYAMCVASQS